ncbi:MAG: histidinol phosphate phosphatase domain-containing protein [Deltaproteobacteria bacterium]|nr:histidinol phosphate phosphatase domain-containing protein [Deltaproteobacteria bacterium]
MIDLHTHSLFSDGALIPSELVRRAEEKGLTAIGITDHGDLSNLDFIIPRLVAVAGYLNSCMDIHVIPGIEITHVPPSLFAQAVDVARRLGARLVIAHGETIVEPVAPGTNRAAIDSKVDVLAHPGLISEADAMLAAKNGVCLEITARKGHSLTNGHVAALAKQVKAKLVINTDSHAPSDLIDMEFALRVVRGAGLLPNEFEAMQDNASEFIKI